MNKPYLCLFICIVLLIHICWMRKHYSATFMQAHHQTRLALSSIDLQHPCLINLSDHAPRLMCAFTIRYCAWFHFAILLVLLGQCADFVWVNFCRCGGTPSLVLSWFLCLIFHLQLRHLHIVECEFSTWANTALIFFPTAGQHSPTALCWFTHTRISLIFIFSFSSWNVSYFII